jgi:RNAse (barnase) inhibitor barstar
MSQFEERAVVPVIELDARDWETTSDFYDALLSALGAPDWHGRCGVAVVDTMLHDDVNNVVPPYRVEVRNSANLPSAVKTHIVEVIDLFDRVRARRRERGADVDVSIVLV